MLQVFSVPQTAVIKQGPKCRLWICDVSGSMGPHVKGVSDDLAQQLSNCDAQDILTVLWFSSEGLRGTIIKGAQIGTLRPQIEAALRKQMYARNLTCFSESLVDARTVIDDLGALGLPWSIMLFSDGFPVVSDYQREIANIFAAIGKLKGVIADATLVGYGDYYNRELLAQMAGALGGTLVHADALPDFSKGMTQHLKTASASRILVPVNGATSVYGLATGKVVVYPVENGQALVSPLEPCVYTYTHEFGKRLKIEADKLLAYYAAALQFGQSNNTAVALEILGGLGDVALIDKLASAFTNAEVGSALQAVEAAVFDEKQHFMAGRKQDYLPKRDAFCLIEALGILQNDSEARFWPDNGFVFKRTGVASKPQEGYPVFVRDENQSVPVNLTWHNTRMNVSLQVEYKGSIELGAQTLGLPATLLCKQFRNYVIIKDGTLNVKALPVSMSRATFLAFVGGKLLPSGARWEAGKIFVLDLTRIPIMNRAMAEGVMAQELVAWSLTDLKLSARQKVLKWRREQLDPDKTEVATVYTPEQLTFLRSLGVDHLGRYSPPTIDTESTDWYMAKTFAIKLKGASSLPKVDDVIARVSAGKALNQAQSAISEAYQWYWQHVAALDVLDEIASIDTALLETKRGLGQIRNGIQKAKASVILGNRWFPEFKSRDKADSIYKYADTEVAFELDTEKVAY
jgi:hypothetical protein